MKICELNPSVRPYERLEQFGASALSDEELLAIVIRSGTKGKSSKEIASQLLSSQCLSSGLSGFHKMEVAEIAKFEGVGRVKAIMIKACLELGRRSVMTSDKEVLRFLCCDDSIRFFQEKMSFLESEEVQAVYLDWQKKMILHKTICKGGVNCVDFSISEVFRTAVRVNAKGLILAHNHPGGSLEASREDIAITNTLVTSGCLLGIDVLDHIIVVDGDAISMLKLGLMEGNQDGD